MAVLGSSWSTYSDLALLEATVEAAANTDTFGPSINGEGTIGSMGHFCYFAMNNTDTAHKTKPFDFPISGDLTIVINPTQVVTDNNTTLDVSMEGSVDGVNYVEMASKTDILQSSDGHINARQYSAVYDYDTKGRMPFMRLSITAASLESDSTIIIAVIPQ